jgi:hypothetical protein
MKNSEESEENQGPKGHLMIGLPSVGKNDYPDLAIEAFLSFGDRWLFRLFWLSIDFFRVHPFDPRLSAFDFVLSPRFIRVHSRLHP